MDPVEERFLGMLREDPADDTTRIIYADWLEAQGEHDRATYLRVVCKLADTSVHRKKAPQLRERLVKLATASEAAWRAIVSRPAVDKCDIQFAFKCPKQWSALTLTSTPDVRHCGACEREVHFCSTLQDVMFHAARSHCVAFDPSLRSDVSSVYDRENPNHSDEMVMEMGEIARD